MNPLVVVAASLIAAATLISDARADKQRVSQNTPAAAQFATPKAAAVSGSAVADISRDVPADDNSPKPLSTGRDNDPGSVIPASEIEKRPDPSSRYEFRLRLDDGRYQGFHQHSNDELRVNDRVQTELDRLRRPGLDRTEK